MKESQINRHNRKAQLRSFSFTLHMLQPNELFISDNNFECAPEPVQSQPNATVCILNAAMIRTQLRLLSACVP